MALASFKTNRDLYNYLSQNYAQFEDVDELYDTVNKDDKPDLNTDEDDEKLSDRERNNRKFVNTVRKRIATVNLDEIKSLPKLIDVIDKRYNWKIPDRVKENRTALIEWGENRLRKRDLSDFKRPFDLYNYLIDTFNWTKSNNPKIKQFPEELMFKNVENKTNEARLVLLKDKNNKEAKKVLEYFNNEYIKDLKKKGEELLYTPNGKYKLEMFKKAKDILEYIKEKLTPEQIKNIPKTSDPGSSKYAIQLINYVGGLTRAKTYTLESLKQLYDNMLKQRNKDYKICESKKKDCKDIFREYDLRLNNFSDYLKNANGAAKDIKDGKEAKIKLIIDKVNEAIDEAKNNYESKSESDVKGLEKEFEKLQIEPLKKKESELKSMSTKELNDILQKADIKVSPEIEVAVSSIISCLGSKDL